MDSIENLANKMRQRAQSEAEAKEKTFQEQEQFKKDIADLQETITEWLNPLTEYGLNISYFDRQSCEHGDPVSYREMRIEYNGQVIKSESNLYLIGFKFSVAFKNNRQEMFVSKCLGRSQFENWQVIEGKRPPFSNQDFTKEIFSNFLQKALNIH